MKRSPRRKSSAKNTRSPRRKSPAKNTRSLRRKSPVKNTRSPRRKSPAKNTRSPRRKSPAKKNKSPRRKSPVKKNKSPRRKSPAKNTRSPRRKSPAKKNKSPISGRSHVKKLMALKGGGKKKDPNRCRTCQGNISSWDCGAVIDGAWRHKTVIKKCNDECKRNLKDRESKAESSAPKDKTDRVINTSLAARFLEPESAPLGRVGSSARLAVSAPLFELDLLESESAPLGRVSSSARLDEHVLDEHVLDEPVLEEPVLEEPVLDEPVLEEPEEVSEHVASFGMVSDLNPDPSRLDAPLFEELTNLQKNYKREENLSQNRTLESYKKLSTYDTDIDGRMTIVYSSDSVNKADSQRRVRNDHTIEVHCTIIRIPKKDRHRHHPKQFYGHITLVINRDVRDIQETYHYGLRFPNSMIQTFWADENTKRRGYLKMLKDDDIQLTYIDHFKPMFPAHNSAKTLLLQYYEWCIESCPNVKPVQNARGRPDVGTLKDTTSW